MPVATDVLSGERADDGVDIPLIKRIEAGIRTTGRLFVGDCQMSALAIRAYVAEHKHLYLSPLPLTGATAEAMGAWIREGMAKDRDGALERMVRFNPQAEAVLAAEGYEFERRCCLQEGKAAWAARVLVIRSPGHAERQAQGLAKRLALAEQQLAALTPARGRGKRQISDEATRREAIDRVLKAQRVDGLLTVAWEQQVEQTIQYVGRGRGSATRAQRVRAHIR
jgi:transposase